MSLSRCLLLMTLAAVVALPACVSSRPSEKTVVPPGAEYRTGLAVEPGYARDLGFSTRWTRSLVLGKGQSVHAAVPLGDLLVVVERPGNVVTAINIADGSLAWKKIVGDDLEILYPPVGDEDNIYVNSSLRIFTLARRDGEIDKVANLAFPVKNGPVLLDKFAVFGSMTGNAFAHHVDDGYKKWVYGLEAPIDTRPVAENNQLFIADAAGNFAMIETKTRALRWRGSTFGPITANPVLDRAFIVFASEDQSLYCYVATTGRERWERFRSEVPLTETPTVIDGVIYLPEPGIGLTAINANTGEAMWTIPGSPTPVTAYNDSILLEDKDKLTTIDPATGETVMSVPTKSLEMIVQGPRDSLIVVSEEGQMLRLDPQ